MTGVDWLGYAAATLTTLSFLPQAWLTLRTRDVSGISLGMYSAFTLGVALWLGYGLWLGQWPIIVANAITLALASTILVLKLSIEAGRRRRAE
jgi:MtN3 and saliva related transmembrane protein